MPQQSSQPTAPRDGASSACHYFSSRAHVETGKDYMRGNMRFYTNLDPNAPLDIGYLRPKNKTAAMESKKEVKKEDKPAVPISFIRSYTAMRGPVAGNEGYPLASWMHRGEHRVAKRTQADDLAGIPSEELAKIPAHPGWEEDPDDVEGAAPSARITPEDFLEFAQGASRWNTDHLKDPQGVLAKQTRVRPEASTELPVRGDKPPYYIYEAKSQYDKNNDEPITPEYDVPTSPSIVYSPPGIPDMPYKTTSFLELYHRMRPTPLHVMDLPTAGTNERYTQSDVKRVVGAHAPAGVTASEAVAQHSAYLEHQLFCVAQMEAQEKEQNAVIAAQKMQIQKLELERDALRHTYIPLLKLRREARARERKAAKERAAKAAEEAARQAKDREERRKYRDGRVSEHLLGRVVDVGVQLDAATLRVNESLQARAEQEELIKRLEQEISEECLMVGKGSFDEVYDAVNRAVPLSATASSPSVGGDADDDNGLKMVSSLSLRNNVSVFEPGAASSVPLRREESDEPRDEDNIYDASPIQRSKSPKGKWVAREGCEFDLTFTQYPCRSEGMSHLGENDSRDFYDAGREVEQEEKKQGDSSRYAHEEAGESSKQGEQGDKSS